MRESTIEKISLAVSLAAVVLMALSFWNDGSDEPEIKMNDSKTAILLENELELQNRVPQLTEGLNKLSSQSALLINSTNTGVIDKDPSVPWPKNDLYPDDFISYVIVENINYTASNCDLNQISYTFTAFLTHDKPVAHTLCGGGGNTLNYAEEITDFLSVSMGFPKFNLAELRDLQIYFAN